MAQDEEDGPVEPAPLPTVREARYSRSLERGLAILGCFTPEHPLLGIAELAEKLSISRPTTHRYVSTLVSLGYLEQDVTRKYRLGLGTIDLGAGLNAMGLCKQARPHLQELARSGYSAEIAVLDGTEILLLDRVHSSRAGQVKPPESVQARTRLPAYCTSMGKVLLAYLPEGLQERLISEMDLAKRGPRTMTSKTALRAQLEDTQQEGLAINDEEMRAGSVAIAAPVREESGAVIAAVGLAACGGVVDVDELVNRFEGKLVATAERISRQLG